MATTMPFEEELKTAQYITSLLGGNKKPNPNYSGEVIKPDMVPEISPTDMNSIMTEWLRTNGQFLDTMRQQNMSGLYNSSTQKLLANDLTAQAALKAATLNSNIKQGNTQLANQYYAKVSTQPSKTIKGGGPSTLDKVLAAALMYLNQGEAKKGSQTKKGKDGKPAEREPNNADKLLETLSGVFPGLADIFGKSEPRPNAADYTPGADSFAYDPGPTAYFDAGISQEPVSYGFDLPEFSAGINPDRADPLADMLYQSVSAEDFGGYNFNPMNPTDYGFGADFSLAPSYNFNAGSGYGTFNYETDNYDYGNTDIYDFTPSYNFGGMGGGSSYGSNDEEYYYDW